MREETPEPAALNEAEAWSVLAEATSLESQFVGAAAKRSLMYPAAAVVRDSGSLDQLLDALVHANPVVRVVVACALLRRFPERALLIGPLLSDAAPVRSVSGCVITSSTVASLVGQAATGALEEGGGCDILRQIVRSRAAGGARGAALRRLTQLDRSAALDASRELLAGGEVESLELVLEVGHGAPLISEGLLSIDGLLAHPNARVRANVPSLLRADPSLEAAERLRQLWQTDPDAGVRRSAVRSYVQRSDWDPRWVRELVDGSEATATEALAALFSLGDAADSAQALLRALAARPRDLGDLLKEFLLPEKVPFIRYSNQLRPLAERLEFTNQMVALVLAHFREAGEAAPASASPLLEYARARGLG